MARTKQVKQKISALERDVSPLISEILEGRILAFDPSSSSASSSPGYSLWEKGILLESGTLELPHGIPLHERLYNLREDIVKEFETPDLLMVERIAPMFAGSAGKFAGQPASVIALHRSIGVIMSSFKTKILEISPVQWRRNVEDDYPKSDSNDATMIGFCAVKEASRLVDRKCPTSDADLKKWIYRK